MRAGALVAATRDRDELLDQIVRLVVPALAECCIVFLPTADGTLGASALGHIDPARAAQLDETASPPDRADRAAADPACLHHRDHPALP